MERRYEEALPVIEQLRNRHVATARELLAEGGPDSGDAYSLVWAERSIEYQFGELSSMARSVATLGELTPRSQDAIVSFGERLSSLLVAVAFHRRGIPVELVDSRHFVITDSHFTAAAPDMRATQRRAREVLLPVIDSGCVPLAQDSLVPPRMA